jgi:hypothetical protein
LRAGNFSAVPGLTLYNPASGLANGNNRIPFPNNIIPASQMSPVARSFLGYFPQPNASGFENNYLANVPSSNNGYRGDARFDHKIGDKLNLFARVSFADYATSQGSVLEVLGGTNGHLENYNAMIGGTMNFSPSWTGDLRLGYMRFADELNNQYNGITSGNNRDRRSELRSVRRLRIWKSRTASLGIDGSRKLSGAAASAEAQHRKLIESLGGRLRVENEPGEACACFAEHRDHFALHGMKRRARGRLVEIEEHANTRGDPSA